MREKRLVVALELVTELRERSGGWHPDPVTAAALAGLGGADGCSLGLRSESSRSQERDARLLRETLQRGFGLATPPDAALLRLVLDVRPDWVLFVERGGIGSATSSLDSRRGVALDLTTQSALLRELVSGLDDAKLAGHLCVQPELEHVKAAHRLGASGLCLDTTRYAHAPEPESELRRIEDAAKLATKLGLSVAAGGALDYDNVRGLAQIAELRSIHVGRAVIARALLIGLERAVQEMRSLIG